MYGYCGRTEDTEPRTNREGVYLDELTPELIDELVEDFEMNDPRAPWNQDEYSEY